MHLWRSFTTNRKASCKDWRISSKGFSQRMLALYIYLRFRKMVQLQLIIPEVYFRPSVAAFRSFGAALVTEPGPATEWMESIVRTSTVLVKTMSPGNESPKHNQLHMSSADSSWKIRRLKEQNSALKQVPHNVKMISAGYHSFSFNLLFRFQMIRLLLSTLWTW